MRFSLVYGRWLAGLIALLVAVNPAFAQRNLTVGAAEPNEQRVALVVGNSAYKESPLKNPVNDAADVTTALRSLGFTVTLRTNANQRQMKQALREFGQVLKKGGVGLFYFAGHGIQYRGRNFLVPVGSAIDSEAELEDESVDANLVLSYMEEAQNRVNIVILDACRNNPFAGKFRSASRGLAQMEAARGSYVAFATAPGSVAADGEGRNGVYTQHLLESLRHSDSDIDKVFRRVTAQVSRTTGGRQVPWVSTSLTGDFYFRSDAQPAALAPAAAAPAAAFDPAAMELAFWDTIKSSSNAADFREYLNQYPNGRFAGLARNRAQSAVPPTHVATVQSFAQNPAQIGKPELKIGDRWVFRVLDLWKNEETETYERRITGVDGDNINLDRTTLSSTTDQVVGRPSKQQANAATWTVVNKQRIEGNYIRFAFPLEVGKTWEYRYKFRLPNGEEVTHERRAKVEGWEEVRVPAGTFKALKVVHSGSWSSASARGTATETLWYAPGIKYPVRREFIELRWDGRLRVQTRTELTQVELQK